jgi:hypothetical protein
MEIHPFDELKRAHRQATFIGMAMISSLIIYVIIVEFMKIDIKGMAAPVIVEIRSVNIFAKMLQNPLPCACLPCTMLGSGPANKQGRVLYPVRKAAGCPVRNFSLLTRSSFLEFTSNGASSGDDGLSYGSEHGVYNAPCEPSR